MHDLMHSQTIDPLYYVAPILFCIGSVPLLNVASAPSDLFCQLLKGWGGAVVPNPNADAK
jgi:hypothetical protein